MLLITLAAIVVGSEVALRLAGYTPWRDAASMLHGALDEPVMNEPDPVIGWVPKPGRYLAPPPDPTRPGAREVVTTIWQDRRRATAEAPRQRPGRGIVLLGGSVTFGWAISDDETFAYRLQERFAGREVYNLAAAGYGTYQSLLRLERFLAESEQPPRVVVYGMVWDHESRNVATAPWQEMLALFSSRGHVAVPFCQEGADGALACEPPQSYPLWPCSEHSALVALLQKQYAALRARDRSRHPRAVTQKILLRMDEVARQHGARLLVVYLAVAGKDQAEYAAVLGPERVANISCLHPKFATPEMMVPGDQHPNGAMNAIWARCMEPPIRTLLRAPVPAPRARGPSQGAS